MSCIGEITIFQIIIPKIPEHSLSILCKQFCIYIESGAETSLQISPFSIFVTLYRETTRKACSIMP